MPNDNFELFDMADIDHEKIMENMNSGELVAFKHRWPQLLVDINDVVNNHLAKALKKSSPEEIQKISDGVIIALSKYLGGRQIYLPSNESLNIAIRDINIWRDHNGRNTEHLAKKYKLTEIYIYSILKAQLALHVNRIQPQLPLGESE